MIKGLMHEIMYGIMHGMMNDLMHDVIRVHMRQRKVIATCAYGMCIQRYTEVYIHVDIVVSHLSYDTLLQSL